MQQHLSSYGKCVKGSVIDQFLDKKDIKRDDSVYLSIGTPSKDNIPIESLKEITERLMKEGKMELFGYGNSLGHTGLRSFISERESVSLDNVMITHGSTQGYDLIARLLLNAGDVVLCENPTYSTGFSVPRNFGAVVVGFDTVDMLKEKNRNIKKTK